MSLLDTLLPHKNLRYDIAAWVLMVFMLMIVLVA